MTPGRIVFLVVANTLAWLVIHLGFAWGGTRLPPGCFHPEAWWFRPRPFERDGRFYGRWFGIRRWKDLVPDGAGWFKGGFRKGGLGATDNAYFERFIVETCRGEFVHWMVFAAGLLFFLCNPPGVGLAMMLYAAIANVPCILIQRYNRVRMRQLLDRRNKTRE